MVTPINQEIICDEFLKFFDNQIEYYLDLPELTNGLLVCKRLHNAILSHGCWERITNRLKLKTSELKSRVLIMNQVYLIRKMFEENWLQDILNRPQPPGRYLTLKKLKNLQFIYDVVSFWDSMAIEGVPFPDALDPTDTSDASIISLVEGSGSLINRIDFEIQNVTVLGIEFKGLIHLPQEIGRFRNIETLILCGNNLSDLPQEFSQLQGLLTLDLSKNNFNTLPIDISQHPILCDLDLSDNNISELPTEVGQHQWEALNLSNTNITDLPEAITAPRKLHPTKMTPDKKFVCASTADLSHWRG